jgi:acetyl esterase/lipase
MSVAPDSRVILEPAALAFTQQTATPPFPFDLGPVGSRQLINDMQCGEIPRADVAIDDLAVPVGVSGTVPIRILRRHGADGLLPVILYLHGPGWVLGDSHTHDRLIRELTAGVGGAVIFPEYSRSPEAPYPTAIEETYATLCWVAEHGGEIGLDNSRIAVAGDSAGANMAIALTLIAKQRSGPGLAAQALFYPVTDARFDTDSYREFAEGYHLRRDSMQWFWDQYTTDEDQRAEITASPLRATGEQLSGLPKALVITAEADVVRDEGEAYARKLGRAGVEVSATRYEGTIHDFMMLDALRETHTAEAAIQQAIAFLRDALSSRD